MKQNQHISLVMALLGVCFFSCQKEDTLDGEIAVAESISLDTRQDACNTASKEFAYSMLEKYESQSAGRGYFFSPLSVEFVLGILANGYEGETRDRICSALGVEDLDALNSYSKKMLGTLPFIDKRSKVTLGNMVLLDKRASFNKKFSKDIKDYYLTEAENKDFSSGKVESYVNSWAKNMTEGKITDILKKGDLANDLLFVANAVYFNSLWSDNLEFDKVRDQKFTTASGKSVKVDMLETNKELSVYEYERYRSLAIPFGNKAYFFNIYLPDEGVGIDEMIDEIKEQKNPLASKRSTLARFPKFKAKYHMDVSGMLSSMGLREVFSDELSGMTPFSPAKVGKIIQDSYIDVNEKGVEAAAITYAIGIGAIFQHSEFIVDRPFIYTIKEISTGAILFMGKYAGE